VGRVFHLGRPAYGGGLSVSSLQRALLGMRKDLNTATLSYHAYELLFLAFQARKRALAYAGRDAGTPDSTVAVVMAAAAVQAFASEFVHYVRRAEACLPAEYTFPAALTEAADEIADQMRSQRDSHLAYVRAWRALGRPRSDDPAAVDRELRLLLRLRNAIVHVVPAVDSQHDGTQAVNTLANRGIADRCRPGEEYAWIHRINVPKVSGWACEVAYAVIMATLEAAPRIADPFDVLDTPRRVYANRGRLDS
jgi:hypothetical protein